MLASIIFQGCTFAVSLPSCNILVWFRRELIRAPSHHPTRKSPDLVHGSKQRACRVKRRTCLPKTAFSDFAAAEHEGYLWRHIIASLEFVRVLLMTAVRDATYLLPRQELAPFPWYRPQYDISLQCHSALRLLSEICLCCVPRTPAQTIRTTTIVHRHGALTDKRA